jgi:hypothetical protein
MDFSTGQRSDSSDRFTLTLVPPRPLCRSLNDLDLSPLPLDESAQFIVLALLDRVGQDLYHTAGPL